MLRQIGLYTLITHSSLLYQFYLNKAVDEERAPIIDPSVPVPNAKCREFLAGLDPCKDCIKASISHTLHEELSLPSTVKCSSLARIPLFQYCRTSSPCSQVGSKKSNLYPFVKM